MSKLKRMSLKTDNQAQQDFLSFIYSFFKNYNLFRIQR